MNRLMTTALIGVLGGGLCTASAWAAPSLSASGVDVAYASSDRSILVSYTLETESAVVTAAFYRRGERIPAASCTAVRGDVNRLVATGSRSFRWKPELVGVDADLAAGDLTVRLTLWPVGSEPPYLVSDLSGASGKFYYASAEDLPGGITNDLYKTSRLVLRRIPAAGKSFTMGSPGSESGRNNDEAQHSVSFGKDYWIGVYPVTQEQLRLVRGDVGNSTFKEPADSLLRPADSCSFKLIRGRSAGSDGSVSPEGGSYLNALSSVTGLSLDLPTEAQWEYAARAGTSGAFWTDIDEIAWYTENAGGETHPVGLKRPNAYGLYDMQGNVRECTLDWYAYTPPTGQDPYNASGGDIVYRSGGFDQPVSDCRVARRRWVGWSNTDAHNGFRVAIRSVQPAASAPVTDEGTLAVAAEVFTRGFFASAGYGSVDDAFDSRFATTGISAGANYNPLKNALVIVLR